MEENELRDKAKELYLKGVKQKDIASELDMSINTLKAWIRRHEWAKEKVAPKTKKGAPQKNKGAPVKDVPKAIESLNANSELTESQKLFCLYYLQSFNATQSYLKAYKCSYETALVNGPRLLGNARVKEELTRLKKELQSEQFFTIQDIIADYARQWKADVSDVVQVTSKEVALTDKNGNKITNKKGEQVTSIINEVFVNPSEQFDGQLIKEITQGRDGISVKLWDKQKAMDQLVKLMPSNTEGGSNITIVDEWGDDDE